MSKRSRPSSPPLAEQQPSVSRSRASANAVDEEDEGDSDTLEVLGAKLAAVGRVNRDVLETIESHRDAGTCRGFDFSLSCRLVQSKPTGNDGVVGDSEPSWNLASTPLGRAKVGTRLAGWRYVGEPLEALGEDAILKDDVEYKLENEKDVVRLNDQLLTLGRLYVDTLVDRPSVRKRMRTLLSNLEKIQVAIGELHELVRSHLESSVTAGDEAIVREELEAAQKAVDTALSNIAKRVSTPQASLELSASVKLMPDYGSENLVSFENPERLSCKRELKLNRCNECILCWTAFSLNGSSFLAQGLTNCAINLVDIEREVRVGRLKHHDFSCGVLALAAFDIDSVPHLASAGEYEIIDIWNLTTRSVVKTLEGHERCIWNMVHFEEDGQHFLASSCTGGLIRVWDLTATKCIRELGDDYVDDDDGIGSVTIAQFKFQGVAYLAAPSEHDGGSIQIWEKNGRARSTDLRSFSIENLGCQIHYYEDRGDPCLACGCTDGKIVLWDLRKGEEIGTISHDNGRAIIDLLVFRRNDNPCLASSAGGDSHCHIWDLAKKCLLTKLNGAVHGYSKLGFLWYRGMPFLASESEEGLKLWTDVSELMYP